MLYPLSYEGKGDDPSAPPEVTDRADTAFRHGAPDGYDPANPTDRGPGTGRKGPR